MKKKMIAHIVKILNIMPEAAVRYIYELIKGISHIED